MIIHIAKRNDVAYVNYDRPVGEELFPFEPKSSEDGGASPLVPDVECGAVLMRAPEVWNDLGITGEGAVVAVIDTGADLEDGAEKVRRKVVDVEVHDPLTIRGEEALAHRSAIVGRRQFEELEVRKEGHEAPDFSGRAVG